MPTTSPINIQGVKELDVVTSFTPTLTLSAGVVTFDMSSQVFPANTPAVAHQFLTGYSSSTGTFTQAQPSASDLSDGVTGTGAVVLAASPAMTGSPTAPTQISSDNSTKLATTAFVSTAIAAIPVPASFDPVTQILVYEEWLNGHNTTTTLTGLGWAISGNGSVAFPIDVSGVRGYVRVNSGAASGNVEVLTTGNAGNNPMMGRFDNVPFDMKFRVVLGQTTNCDFVVGLNAGTSIAGISRGMYVRYQTSLGDTKFTFEISGATSNQISVVNSINADTSYHSFRIRGTGNGDIFFSVDGGTETLITCASAGGVATNLRIFHALATNAAVNATFDEDYMYLLVSGLTR